MRQLNWIPLVSVFYLSNSLVAPTFSWAGLTTDTLAVKRAWVETLNSTFMTGNLETESATPTNHPLSHVHVRTIILEQVGATYLRVGEYILAYRRMLAQTREDLKNQNELLEQRRQHSASILNPEDSANGAGNLNRSISPAGFSTDHSGKDSESDHSEMNRKMRNYREIIRLLEKDFAVLEQNLAVLGRSTQHSTDGASGRTKKSKSEAQSKPELGTGSESKSEQESAAESGVNAEEESSYQRLIAVIERNLSEIKKSPPTYFKLDRVNGSGAQLLTFAATTGNFALANLLVKQGQESVDLNEKTEPELFQVDEIHDSAIASATTPLQAALESREYDIATAIIAAGADVSFAGGGDIALRIILHQLAQSIDSEIRDHLTESDANYALNSFENEADRMRVKLKFKSMVHLLIQKMSVADLKVLDTRVRDSSEDRAALFKTELYEPVEELQSWALEEGYDDLAQELFTKGVGSVRSSGLGFGMPAVDLKYEALCSAAAELNSRQIATLIRLNVSVSGPIHQLKMTLNEKTPLWLALENRSSREVAKRRVVELLIDHGADLTQPNKDKKFYPIMKIVQMNSELLVRKALAALAVSGVHPMDPGGINYPNDQGLTAVTMAALAGQSKNLAILFDQGGIAYVPPGNKILTPTMAAVKSGDRASLKLVLGNLKKLERKIEKDTEPGATPYQFVSEINRVYLEKESSTGVEGGLPDNLARGQTAYNLAVNLHGLKRDRSGMITDDERDDLVRILKSMGAQGAPQSGSGY